MTRTSHQVVAARAEGLAEDPSALADKIALAEASVIAMKDLELRKVAFEKVLEKLLYPPAKRMAHARTEERKTLAVRGGPKGYLAELVTEGFFDQPRALGDAQKELRARGHHIAITSLSGPMQSLCQARRLRRQSRQVDGKGARKIYLYSRW
jgi:hypothetical protein